MLRRLRYQLVNWLVHRRRGWRQELMALANLGVQARLSATVYRADGTIESYGILSRRVITTAGVNALVDAAQGLGPLFSNFKWHDSGTSNAAESSANTTLGAPAGPARVSGTQGEGASANIYKTVGTITYGGSATIVEHGLFDASTSGVLLDRSVFSGIPVALNDAIQFTYELTIAAGG